MFEFRVTKYDPAHRDEDGAYRHDEWTSVSGVGHSFNGVVLTEADYQRVEDAYATAAIAFMREAGVANLAIMGLENSARLPLPFSEGTALDLTSAASVLRRVLREEIWCRLEAADAFLHIGYDYSMYVGVEQPCPDAAALAQRLGLFVEPFRSPYVEER